MKETLLSCPQHLKKHTVTNQIPQPPCHPAEWLPQSGLTPSVATGWAQPLDEQILGTITTQEKRARTQQPLPDVDKSNGPYFPFQPLLSLLCCVLKPAVPLNSATAQPAPGMYKEVKLHVCGGREGEGYTCIRAGLTTSHDGLVGPMSARGGASCAL